MARYVACADNAECRGTCGSLGVLRSADRQPLDILATPAALVAGTVVSAAVMTDMPPMVKWTAAVIAGGGIAGLTQGVTGMLRAHSTVLTGGLGNAVIATAELGGALLISFLALAAPAAAVALVILLLLLAMRLLRRLSR